LPGHATLAARRCTLVGILGIAGLTLLASDSVRREVTLVVVRWQNSALTLTKADAVAISAANATQKYRVAVLEELTRFTTWKCDLFFAAPTQLEK